MFSTYFYIRVCLRVWDTSLRRTFPEMYYQLILAYISSVTVTTKTFGTRKHDRILMTPVTSSPDTGLGSLPNEALQQLPQVFQAIPCFSATGSTTFADSYSFLLPKIIVIFLTFILFFTKRSTLFLVLNPWIIFLSKLSWQNIWYWNRFKK